MRVPRCSASTPCSTARMRLLCALTAALGAAVITACSTSSPARTAPAAAEAPPSPLLPDPWIPVVRHGRYTLVELRPTATQRDLLLQVVEVSLPTTAATVEEGLRHALLRSGYRLCTAGPDTDRRMLYQLPLPTVHRQLGPLTLRDALLTLAGPPWALQVDDASRTVCFIRQTQGAR